MVQTDLSRAVAAQNHNACHRAAGNGSLGNPLQHWVFSAASVMQVVLVKITEMMTDVCFVGVLIWFIRIKVNSLKYS
jgi:hypothetical protein